jgi:hypothetical protein
MIYLVFFLCFALTNGAVSAHQQSLMPVKGGMGLKSLIDLMKKNSTSFIKQMENADPAKLQSIISLLEELVNEALTQKGAMGTAIVDAQNLLDDKAAALATAEGARVAAQQAVDAAQTARDAAQGARDTAQSDSDTGVPVLDNEIQTLRNVISILQAMLGVQSYAGEYEVWYNGGQRGTNMIINCDNSCSQPGIFTDALHFDGVSSQCPSAADANAEFYILGTHGAGKFECLHSEGTTISGNHYTGVGSYWGTIEYRLIQATTC